MIFGDAGRGLFNPFYMRKFFVSWRRIPSIFRWRFFFVYSPQKYFLKQIIFKLSLSLGNAFSYFSIFHFFFIFFVLRFELKRKTKRWEISMALKENVLKNKKKVVLMAGWVRAYWMNHISIFILGEREGEWVNILLLAFLCCIFYLS